MEPLENSIRQQIEYREGKLFWKACRNSTLVGRECGHLASHGYRVLKIGSEIKLTHRVVWFLHHNEWPPEDKVMDHINGNRLDNRIENLRIATRSQNGANRKYQTNNTSGYRGVHWVKADKIWRASIKVNNKVKQLGRYKTAEEASEVYELAADLLFGEFKRGGL